MQDRCRGEGHRPGITPLSGRGGTSSNLVEQESQSTPPRDAEVWAETCCDALRCLDPERGNVQEPVEAEEVGDRSKLVRVLVYQEQQTVETCRHKVFDGFHNSLDQEVLDMGVPDLSLELKEPKEGGSGGH